MCQGPSHVAMWLGTIAALEGWRAGGLAAGRRQLTALVLGALLSARSCAPAGCMPCTGRASRDRPVGRVWRARVGLPGPAKRHVSTLDMLTTPYVHIAHVGLIILLEARVDPHVDPRSENTAEGWGES